MPSGSKGAPSVRGADKAKTGREATLRKPQAQIYSRQTKVIPKWNVTEYIPPRKISDKELEAARKMFFDLDRDGSGSIDAEELGQAMRQLGQNPSEDELIALIESVDDGDKDGDGDIDEDEHGDEGGEDKDDEGKEEQREEPKAKRSKSSTH